MELEVNVYSTLVIVTTTWPKNLNINEKLDKQIPQQLFNEGISCGIDEC